MGRKVSRVDLGAREAWVCLAQKSRVERGSFMGDVKTCEMDGDVMM